MPALLRRLLHPLGFALLLVLMGCGEDQLAGFGDLGGDCLLEPNELFDGGPGKDGIPALVDPTLISADAVDYLTSADRVIGLVVGGEAIAVPLNILWWHEIANFNFATGAQWAVTFCPLTGSSMVFDRAAVGGGEFGVSGLLFQNNLVMYDRTNDESLWPQMMQQAGCGPRTPAVLPLVAAAEMRWDGWQALHPDTRVISGITGFPRNYTAGGYPYGTYEDPQNANLLFPMPGGLDARRPPKERVLGLPDADGGLAFPFGALDAGGPVQAVPAVVGGQDVVVFWHRSWESAQAFVAEVAGQPTTFTVLDDDTLQDAATGSIWRVDGLALAGPQAGTRLTPVADAYVAFWFAWAAFHPETRLWTGA